jgi:very-short-patch-repair endonuclease
MRRTLSISLKISEVENELAFQIKAAGLPVPARQMQIIPARRFRWDFAWPSALLAVEVQGGLYSGGAHVRAWGVTRDAEKNNLVVLAGWRVLYFTSEAVRSGRALSVLETALKTHPGRTRKGQDGREGFREWHHKPSL